MLFVSCVGSKRAKSQAVSLIALHFWGVLYFSFPVLVRLYSFIGDDDNDDVPFFLYVVLLSLRDTDFFLPPYRYLLPFLFIVTVSPLLDVLVEIHESPPDATRYHPTLESGGKKHPQDDLVGGWLQN